MTYEGIEFVIRAGLGRNDDPIGRQSNIELPYGPRRMGTLMRRVIVVIAN